MIAITSINFDPDGHIVLRELASSDLGGVSRRVNRVATLDGGAAINDGGYTAADRTFRIDWAITSAAQFAAVQRMVRVYPRLRVHTADGVFVAAPESVNEQNGEGQITLLVLEELTA